MKLGKSEKTEIGKKRRREKKTGERLLIETEVDEKTD